MECCDEGGLDFQGDVPDRGWDRVTERTIESSEAQEALICLLSSLPLKTSVHSRADKALDAASGSWPTGDPRVEGNLVF